ncbi:MAG TPA: branched-chain amino acid ABC transporter permease, partial [Roseiflexaceae bacterium]|nr:branched-chain amino acid ABC transporter permease [Roseiflexaceae bacterium]
MISSETLFQALTSGLLMGSAYALIAIGFTVVFGVMRIVNFGHGHLVMAAMFASYALHRYVGLDPYVSAVLVFPAFIGLGAFLHRVVIVPIMDASHAAHMLTTLGLLLVIENAMNLIFGGDLRSVNTSLSGQSLILGGVALPWTRLVAAAVSLIAIGGIWMGLKYTRFGTEIRAAADNRIGAMLVGVPIQRVFLRAFALATATAAVAG